MAFNADETHLFEFWKENFHTGEGEPSEEDFANAINPGNYGPMPSSGTKKDMTYDLNYKGHFIPYADSMGKCRQVHYHQMVHANANATQDYHNTFCVSPHTIELHELSH